MSERRACHVIGCQRMTILYRGRRPDDRRLRERLVALALDGRLRDKFLNETTFTSLAQARVLLEDWRRDYNSVRPHSGIGWLTPDAYAAQFIAQRGRTAALAGGYASRPVASSFFAGHSKGKESQSSQVKRGPKNQSRSVNMNRRR